MSGPVCPIWSDQGSSSGSLSWSGLNLNVSPVAAKTPSTYFPSFPVQLVLSVPSYSWCTGAWQAAGAWCPNHKCSAEFVLKCWIFAGSEANKECSYFHGYWEDSVGDGIWWVYPDNTFYKYFGTLNVKFEFLFCFVQFWHQLLMLQTTSMFHSYNGNA